jgi:spore coat polysaccharide biosynthesis protein SpsF
MIVGVIQARVTSSRLPGKVLLPIRGHPAAVLAAQRAANLGLRVLVATSDHGTDDLLVAILREHGLPVVRGPLEDVLKRFVIATEDLPESTIVPTIFFRMAR